MTTIISIPFKDGIVVASDTQATDMSSLEKYTSYNKTTSSLGYSNEGVEIYVSGAGISVGTQVVMTPFIKYFEQKSEDYCVDLNQLSLVHFMDYFNNLGAQYLRTTMTNLEYNYSEHCSFLLTIRTKKFLATFKTSGPGGLCISNLIAPYSDDPLSHMTNLVGTGSGSRYVLGAFAFLNESKKLDQLELEQLIEILKNYFDKVIALDMGSSCKSGLNLRIVYKDWTKPSIKLRF